MAGNNQFDENEIRKAYSIMRSDDSLVEIRIIEKSGKIHSGYFNSVDVLIDNLRKFNLSESQVYMTINKINEACYSRQQRDCFKTGNKLTTTSDNDIIGYTFFMVDIDPKRPAETSASDEELQKAKTMGNQVYSFLSDLGFEKPILAYSGNGVHLMYRIKLKNSEDNKKLIKKCLNTLDMLFSNEECEVDTSTFNQARISKLYGCVARKGLNTQERPHRMSRINGEYTEVKTTDIKYFEKLCGYYPEQPEKPQKYNNYSPRDFDIEGWMSKYGLGYRTGSYADGTKYILDCCPFNSQHKGKDACIFRNRSGAIGFHCFHSSCSDKTWQDVRLLYEPDAHEKKEREFTQRIYQKQPKPLPKIEQKEGRPVLYTAEYIRGLKIENEEFVKTGIYVIDKKMRGLKKGYISLLSGLRASGKSSIISELCLNCVDYGYNVCVFSGELSPKNFMRWMYLQAAGKKYVEPTDFEGYYNVTYKTQEVIAKWLGEKFWLYNNEYGNGYSAILEQFEKAVDEKKLDLLIFDNLMALNISDLADNKWDAQTQFVLSLKKLAERKHIHILFVAHPRKAMGFLRLDDVSGTADLSNAVDNAFIIHRVNEDFKRLSKQMFNWKDGDDIFKATNVIEIAKDRDNGLQDVFIQLFYEPETKRLKNYFTENRIYGWLRNNGNNQPEPQKQETKEPEPQKQELPDGFVSIEDAGINMTDLPFEIMEK